ncbi:MAG: Cof-type HAD-IIB family hydrolase [Clostridia bacterium]|nr:Cof-type HAD-IIB family hydrolase [Clostridia bacterium]
MKYRLFCSDFDGTLVRADGTISNETKKEIARYTEAGGIFTVVTGRMTSSILPRVREFMEEGIVVAYQGAVIADLKTGRLLKNACFEEADALRAVRLLEEGNHHIHVYTDEGLFVNRRDEMLNEYERICGVTGTVKAEKLSDWLIKTRPPVVKILVMIEPEKRLALKDELQKKLGETYFVTCSNDWLVELMPAGQDKGSAIRFLSEYFGVPKGEIGAIGDQLNDLPMLKEAGGKFAVSNAQEELKNIATVVKSCEEDGVAEALMIAREGK